MDRHFKFVLSGAVLAGVLGYLFTVYSQNAQFSDSLIGMENGGIIFVIVLVVNLASKKGHQ
ncbi:hypothetical protein [Lactiplantibacillus xiangfangensis]|uniref:hypothetical protein n=1 Tax=Lactiplantibacillus xiangfangensis TaxID=942150 RepID=UPI0007090199|nr:hypothetical protein [Lactiplantibacillus xiangfangensis]